MNYLLLLFIHILPETQRASDTTPFAVLSHSITVHKTNALWSMSSIDSRETIRLEGID